MSEQTWGINLDLHEHLDKIPVGYSKTESCIEISL